MPLRGAGHSLLPLLFLLLLPFVLSIPNFSELRNNKKACKLAAEGEPCYCIIRSRSKVNKDCCCTGMDINDIPANLTAHLKTLTLFNVGLERVDMDAFSNYENLEEIEIASAPNLASFDFDSLKGLLFLRKVSVHDCPRLTQVNGTIDEYRKLSRIDFRSNAIESLPRFDMPPDLTDPPSHPTNSRLDSYLTRREMDVIDFTHNAITRIPSLTMQHLSVRILRVSFNRLSSIEAFAFNGSKVHNMELNGNPSLNDLHVDAFKGMPILNNLNLSETSLTKLPSEGMQTVKILILKKVETLKQLPPILSFSSLTTAYFTYPHHCCLFKHVSKMDLDQSTKQQRKQICKKTLEEGPVEGGRRKRDDTGMWHGFVEDEDDDDDEEYIIPESELSSYNSTVTRPCLEKEEITYLQVHYNNVSCYPEPDAMNPCENIVGFAALRYAIWFIWILAVGFNFVVWVLLGMAYESRLRSHYLFMFNLSFANALTAVYLGFLAVEDQLTADEYFRFAVGWQTGSGCAAAGFLCVFSSLLSILSMFFIAFEIAYSTRVAIYGRHLPFHVTIYCVIFSYLFSLSMAALPLVGVSSYSKTSTCLPLHIESVFDKAYIITGLLVIIVAFIGMAACYGSIFKILIDPNTPSRPEDHHIVFKMLLLIVTDLICWMPSAGLGLAAAFGHPLISISVAKIFIVCFFPVNAFTNPFLYVFFTKVIQRKVRKKAIPLLSRIGRTSTQTLNHLSNLYHPHAPDEKGNKGRRKSDESAKVLYSTLQNSPNQETHTTQSTWVTSEAHRGSAESTGLLDADGGRRRSTPRVSFQSDSIALPEEEKRSRSPFRLGGILKKVSAIPEVSDLSEHSSDSHHEHSITRPSDLPRDHSSALLLHDCSHHGDMAVDSGRGSLASIFGRGEDSSSSSSDGLPLHSSFRSSRSKRRLLQAEEAEAEA